MWYVARKEEVSIDTAKMPAGMAAGREKEIDLVRLAVTAPGPFHFRFHCLLFKADRDVFWTQEGCGFGFTCLPSTHATNW